ncbi:MAG TPA: 3-oxoacyl-ACP reductase, partial [Betaproteobacteria bacterium]|nr:3-oxoacyl-ACP reductase [Betaproteobacteria bacterium]
MELELSGRTCLVSGASAGIGAGIARVLAREGVRVAMTARRGDRLQQLAAEIGERGGVPPVVVAGDITQADEITRIVDESISRLGRIDILVNSAGGFRALSSENTHALWEEAFALNFTAARRLTEAVL